MKLILLLFLNSILFFGCSHYGSKQKISSAEVWLNLWKVACESSEGKGQIFLPNRTYAFSYESIFNEKDQWWALALEAPLRGEETLIVPFDEKKMFEGSLLSSLDAQAKKKLTPSLLKKWKKGWLAMLHFLKAREQWSRKNLVKLNCLEKKSCQGQESDISWLYGEEKIELSFLNEKAEKEFTWIFKRNSEEYFFSEQIVTLRHQKNSQTISLHLYPTRCSI